MKDRIGPIDFSALYRLLSRIWASHCAGGKAIKRSLSLSAGLVTLLGLMGTPLADTPDTRRLIFGFIPALSPKNLATRFQPMTDYLGKSLGVEISLESAPNFRAFIDRAVVDRRYAFMMSGGNTYHDARRRAGYRAIARIARPAVTALIVTAANSGIASLNALKGRTIATLDELALSTHLGTERLGRAGLVRGRHYSFVHVPTQNASLLSALRGSADAAIVIDLVYVRLPEHKKRQLRILAESLKFPDHPLSVAPWVSEELADRTRSVLLGLSSSAEGKSLLARMRWPGFVQANPDDYDIAMRQLEDGMRDR